MSACPLCGAPHEGAIGLGMGGRIPGDRYICGTIFIREGQQIVTEAAMCRYAAGLRHALLDEHQLDLTGPK